MSYQVRGAAYPSPSPHYHLIWRPPLGVKELSPHCSPFRFTVNLCCERKLFMIHNSVINTLIILCIYCVLLDITCWSLTKIELVEAAMFYALNSCYVLHLHDWTYVV